jgi:hypothetical protein
MMTTHLPDRFRACSNDGGENENLVDSEPGMTSRQDAVHEEELSNLCRIFGMGGVVARPTLRPEWLGSTTIANAFLDEAVHQGFS